MTAPTVHEIEVPLVRNRPPLSANQRLHWRPEATLKKLVRTSTALRARDLKLGACKHLTVQLHYATGDNRVRRDPANLCATSKPAIDGLVDAGLVPDDNPTYVTERMPEVHLGPGTRRLWLTVEATR